MQLIRHLKKQLSHLLLPERDLWELLLSLPTSRIRRKGKCHGMILRPCLQVLHTIISVIRTRLQRRITLRYSIMLLTRDLPLVAVWEPIIIMVIRYVRYIRRHGWCEMRSINIPTGMLICRHYVSGLLCRRLVNRVLWNGMKCWILGIRF